MWLFRKRKKFARKAEEIREVLLWQGPDGCLATDRITVDGCKVGYMYRQEPDGQYPDSGWRFFEGGESQAYLDDPKNISIYQLNTICNYDPDIIPLLNAPFGTAYARDDKGVFQQEPLELLPDA